MLGSRMALPTHSTCFIEGKSSPVLWTASGVCQCLSLNIPTITVRIMSIVDSSICDVIHAKWPFLMVYQFCIQFPSSLAVEHRYGLLTERELSLVENQKAIS